MKDISISFTTEEGDFKLELPGSAPRAHCLRVVSFGEKKIYCIKEVRQHTGLGLKEAKEAIEQNTIVELDSDRACLDLAKEIERHGGAVQLIATSEAETDSMTRALLRVILEKA